MEIITLTCKRCKDMACQNCGKDMEAGWNCYSSTGECRREIPMKDQRNNAINSLFDLLLSIGRDVKNEED